MDLIDFHFIKSILMLEHGIYAFLRYFGKKNNKKKFLFSICKIIIIIIIINNHIILLMTLINLNFFL